MDFGNFRKKSVKIGKDRKFKKSFRMPSGKRRVHSDSGRHHDDRCRNTPSVFQKASDTFLMSYLYRAETEIAEVHADIARSFLSLLYPCYLKSIAILKVNQREREILRFQC